MFLLNNSTTILIAIIHAKSNYRVVVIHFVDLHNSAGNGYFSCAILNDVAIFSIRKTGEKPDIVQKSNSKKALGPSAKCERVLLHLEVEHVEPGHFVCKLQ